MSKVADDHTFIICPSCNEFLKLPVGSRPKVLQCPKCGEESDASQVLGIEPLSLEPSDTVLPEAKKDSVELIGVLKSEEPVSESNEKPIDGGMIRGVLPSSRNLAPSPRPMRGDGAEEWEPKPPPPKHAAHLDHEVTSVQEVVEAERDAPAPQRTKIRSRWQEQRNWQLWALMILCVAAVVGVSLFFALSDPAAPTGKNAQATGDRETAPPTKDGAPAPITSQQAADSLIAFLDAKTVNDILPHIARGTELVPAIETYYANVPFRQLSYTVTPDASQFVTADHGGLETKTSIAGYGMQLFSMVDDRGEYRVDWESYVGLGQMPWEQFVEEMPAESVWLRAYVVGADFYADEFTNTQSYRCLRITDITGRHRLYAYISLDSDQFEAVERALGRDNIRFRAIVRVSFPEDAKGSGQVFLDSLEQIGWVKNPE